MEIQIPKENSSKIMGLLMALSKEFPEHTNDLLELTRAVNHGLIVEILPFKFNHTREQENYYRKWCREFANHCGMPPDTMHDEILCLTFGSDNVSTPFGWRRTPVKRSSELRVDDYAELIETLIRTASEMGFVVPPPIRNTADY